MSKKKGLGKFLAGITLGAGLGVLFAPKKGSETRAELKIKFDELIKKAKEIDKEEVKAMIELKIDEIKLALEDLDKEKAMHIAKEKAEQIKDKAEELVTIAKEKGTPVLKKAADEAKSKAADVVREVLKKLEEPKDTKKKEA